MIMIIIHSAKGGVVETRCSRLRFEFGFPQSDRRWLCKPGGQRDRCSTCAHHPLHPPCTAPPVVYITPSGDGVIHPSGNSVRVCLQDGGTLRPGRYAHVIRMLQVQQVYPPLPSIQRRRRPRDRGAVSSLPEAAPEHGPEDVWRGWGIPRASIRKTTNQ